MTYCNKIYECVRADMAHFERDCGVCETHVMLHVTDMMLSCEAQLSALIAVFDDIQHSVCADAEPVFMRLFASDLANQHSIIKDTLSHHPYHTISIVEQPPLDGAKFALWIWFQSDVDTKRSQNGFDEVYHSSYRQLFSVRQHCNDTGSEAQARHLLTDYVDRLHQEGLALADNCIRTWFFVQNVDANYSGLVKARNEVFAQQGLTPDTHFIASTGIGGRYDDHRVSVLMDTYAIDGLQPTQVRYLHASTHLNRTSEYGVSFERATSIDYGDRRHVFISGTASINSQGSIMYPCDIRRQTERMTENVGALLAEADCSWHDVMHAIVYLRDISDRAVVEAYFDEHYPSLPRVFLYARVCRPGWLVEMECMAVRAVDNPAFAPL